jgi:hypothetical protein
MATNSSNDFRDWDIDVETRYSGYDELGFPFYLWRESADNRLTLSRPRYCCVMPVKDVLCFVFFDPSKDIKSTGAMNALYAVAGLVTIAMLTLGWFERQNARGPYASDMSAPPFLILVSTVFYALFLGSLVGGIWYAGVTVYRWINGRFNSDGRIVMMPLGSLDGFQVLNAGEAGAIVNGEPAKTGHGLAAVFDDGTQIILTGNAWNYRSIADQHRDMTIAFCKMREEYVKPWSERLKMSVKSEEGSLGVNSSSLSGLPDKL